MRLGPKEPIGKPKAAPADATLSRFAKIRDLGKHSGVEMREASDAAGLHPLDDVRDGEDLEQAIARRMQSMTVEELLRDTRPSREFPAVERLEDLRGEVDPADMRRRHEEGVRLNGGYSDDSRDSAHDRPMLYKRSFEDLPKKVTDSRGQLSKDPEPGREYDEKGRLKARSIGEGYEAFKAMLRNKGGR